MTDEGDGLGDQSLTPARDRPGQAPDGQRAGSGTGDAGGMSMNGTGPQDPGGAIQASADGASSSGPLASTPPGPADASAAGEGNETDASAPGGRKAPGKRSAKGTPKKSRSFWKELPVLIIVALILTLIIKTYFIQAFFIPSGSMQNTLAISDRVLVNKIVYDTRSIHRGDIAVFSGDGSWNPGTPPASSNFFARFGESVASMFGFAKNQNDYIKRVIGLPGDHVACCDAQGRVTVNGVPLNEKSYLYPGNPPSEQRFSITVPAGSLWVMGDHRDVSWDSRGHRYYPGGGSVPESAVVGRAFVVIWPLSQWSILSIPSTFEQKALNSAAGQAPASGKPAQDAAAGAPVSPSSPVAPLALGFVGAVPVTLLQRKLRTVARRRVRR
jgi:signal peptidase I